ncbi:LOW QUALITY PROTEIN: hypothetical protein U9M48_030453 [Paspalum notatum var. saurae]|uniref:Transposase-associated domain-containing protein n=1 Tax=Paspalum notatum var. saurae TaxID=547442 RepID=A0AAQ3U3M0_PASNO
MDRQWMYKDRRSVQFLDGMVVFIVMAKKCKKLSGFISCPCIDCKNEKEYSSSRALHRHLLRRGFMSGYVCWTKYGELGVLEGENEEEDGNIDFAQYNSFADTLIGDADDEGNTDALAQMLHDAKEDCDNERDWKKLERMLEDHRTFLYPDCKEDHKKLRSTLELLWWKASNGLEVQKIHKCPNKCILYRGDYHELESCPVCKASRYKIKRDDPRDVEGEPPRKRVPAMVMWYFPIIPRLRLLFRNKEHSKIFGGTKKNQDDMLSHPVDGSQWRKIDRTYPEFIEDARNRRLCLSMDGMNSFSEMSNSHCTWPTTLCIYNLPPCLCVKRKFIMMPALIQGPKQSGNDTNVYLQPLVEKLLLLWTEGVCMWDVHKIEAFDPRALLFVTINDWPALTKLSRQSNKGFKACVHCLYDTDSTYLKHCMKVVYVGESARHRSPNNDPPSRGSRPPPKNPTKPQTHRIPPSRKTSKSSQKKTISKSKRKCPYEETQEETEKAVKSYVKEQLAPKPPEKPQKIDPKVKQHFKMMMEPHEEPRLSDYER